MDFLLPATTYQAPPPRQARRHLNTIMEDHEQTNFGMAGDGTRPIDDRTITARPAGLDEKLAGAALQYRPARTQNRPSSPVSVVSSENNEDSRSLYSDSDAGTALSESCPSLTGSHASAVTMLTQSNRNSLASIRSRNRYPSLLIPRDSWASENEIKQVALGISPATKITLSSDNLRTMPRHTPSADMPPSLGDASSIRSDASPYLRASSSVPPTPDLSNLEVGDNQAWGSAHNLAQTPLEIAVDEHHSILLSPEEAHGHNHSRHPSEASTDWTAMMSGFPLIPGATPTEMTPVTPNIPRGERFEDVLPDFGIQLPTQALQILNTLTRSPSPGLQSEASVHEMQERPIVAERPTSFVLQTPLSAYSFSSMSIPSPGGFFSSLDGGAAKRWSSPVKEINNPNNSNLPPSSSTAENFYNIPWTRSDQVVETVLEVDGSQTDGPPTVRQAAFDRGITSPRETSDLYGSGTPVRPTLDRQSSEETVVEYDPAYESNLKHASEANLNRTSNWLAEQNTYMAALRETNPLNDPADYPAVVAEDSASQQELLQGSETRKAVGFLEEATHVTCSPAVTPTAPETPTEPVFFEAFTHQVSQKKQNDIFLQSPTRHEQVQVTRIALPEMHVQSLLNRHSSGTLAQHERPKYRGPPSQNPRNSEFSVRTEEQAAFNKAELEQQALAAIQPGIWATEAQSNILRCGRLFANRGVCDRIARKLEEDRSVRILDLAGNATASWAWVASHKWPNAQIYTVQSQRQADLTNTGDEGHRPALPDNHRLLTVPHLWKLPFKSGYFDAISARSLYMYLRSTPVPRVESINEWDMCLKECMRVLRPGGVLEFFVLDASISSSSMTQPEINLSPSAMSIASTIASEDVARKTKAVAAAEEFRDELKRRGYDTDGGSSQMMLRLKNAGFVGMKRQFIGLPVGRQASIGAERAPPVPQKDSHWSSQFTTDTTRKVKAFFSPRRPISETSPVSRIVDHYFNIEAVSSPAASTGDVTAMSSLVGESLWEEWLVRLRAEAGKASAAELLEGIPEAFDDWRRTGKAAWKGMVGWARKPTIKERRVMTESSTATVVPAAAPALPRHGSSGLGLKLNTKVAGDLVQQELHHRQQRSLRRFNSTASYRSVDYTNTAVERGDVMEIPMMMIAE